MYNIKLLNKISPAGLSQFNLSRYHIGEDIENPDAVIVRSANMHDLEIADSLRAVARAGAGTNNIPVDEFSKRGIVVFNTPGANANAVKEMVITGLLISSRKVNDGINWAKTLTGQGEQIAPLVEKGKSAFSGPEIAGKTLGVIGLGAIGVLVANTAHSLGMEVLGYDPYISIDAAWGLSRSVKKIDSLKTIFSECDYITLHVPLTPETKDLLNEEAFNSMKPGIRILNFARGDLVNEDDLGPYLESGRVACYVTDFPSEKTLAMSNTICIPHLGASTPESEDNCAAMAARQLMAFLESGIIKNSVNFPNVETPKDTKTRICLIHKNVPAMINKISEAFAEACINIEHLTNKSRKGYAFTFVDVDVELSSDLIKNLKAIDGMISVREIR
jgi:D-3-phosphoglycerate dehydrogenase